MTSPRSTSASTDHRALGVDSHRHVRARKPPREGSDGLAGSAIEAAPYDRVPIWLLMQVKRGQRSLTGILPDSSLERGCVEQLDRTALHLDQALFLQVREQPADRF